MKEISKTERYSIVDTHTLLKELSDKFSELNPLDDQLSVKVLSDGVNNTNSSLWKMIHNLPFDTTDIIKASYIPMTHPNFFKTTNERPVEIMRRFIPMILDEFSESNEALNLLIESSGKDSKQLEFEYIEEVIDIQLYLASLIGELVMRSNNDESAIFNLEPTANNLHPRPGNSLSDIIYKLTLTLGDNYRKFPDRKYHKHNALENNLDVINDITLTSVIPSLLEMSNYFFEYGFQNKKYLDILAKKVVINNYNTIVRNYFPEN